jgi:hypothetical protein
VNITVVPVIQVIFKASPGGDVPEGESLHSRWEIHAPPPKDPSKEMGPGAIVPRRTDAANLPATITVPASVVDSGGVTEVTYLNLPSNRILPGKKYPFATSVTINPEDISVLYRVGGFEGNFLRGMTFILVELAFIAALSIFAGSFLGFAVASLTVFVLLPFSFLRAFLADAQTQMPPDFIGYIVRAIMSVMTLLLPDLERFSPTSNLVSGLAIPWDHGTLGAMTFALTGIGLVLAFACLIFHKRELARVQL